MIIWPKDVPPPDGRLAGLYAWGGREGPLAQFLDDFGPALLEKYKPKGIVVFSAHWETERERLGAFESYAYRSLCGSLYGIDG